MLSFTKRAWIRRKTAPNITFDIFVCMHFLCMYLDLYLSNNCWQTWKVNSNFSHMTSKWWLISSSSQGTWLFPLCQWTFLVIIMSQSISGVDPGVFIKKKGGGRHNSKTDLGKQKNKVITYFLGAVEIERGHIFVCVHALYICNTGLKWEMGAWPVCLLIRHWSNWPSSGLVHQLKGHSNFHFSNNFYFCSPLRGEGQY